MRLNVSMQAKEPRRDSLPVVEPAFTGNHYQEIFKEHLIKMRGKLTRTGLTLGIVAVLAATGFAQPQSPATTTAAAQQGGAEIAPQQRPERRGRQQRDGRGNRSHRGGRGVGRMLSRLNLSDAQRQQVRSIMERNFQNMQAARDELRQLAQQRRQGTLSPDAEARIQTLHNSLGESMRRASDEALATLTPEQRTQLEQFKQERKERGHRGERGMRDEGHRRRGFLRDFNLTEAQQQQMNAIRQRFAETVKPQRDALRQLREQQQGGASSGADISQRASTLRAQIREASKGLREEMLNVLTPEQRTQFEQRRQEMHNRRDQFRQRRQPQRDNIQ